MLVILNCYSGFVFIHKQFAIFTIMLLSIIIFSVTLLCLLIKWFMPERWSNSSIFFMWLAAIALAAAVYMGLTYAAR